MNNHSREKRILVVDDEAETRNAVSALLTTQGYAAVAATDGRTALVEIARLKPDLVLVDLFMPELDGIELITLLREITPEIPTVAMANRVKPFTVDYIEIATKLGAFAGLYKPLDDDRLLEIVDSALLRVAAPASVPAMTARMI
jgi:CheY-like chemotaxis protein